MGIYEELKARGLVAQVTDEDQVREMLNNGKAILTRRRTACMSATSWRSAS